MKDNKHQFQLAWGFALLIMGIAVCFRIPHMIDRAKEFEYFASIIWFVYFCLYLIPAILVVGGIKKIYHNLKSQEDQDLEDPK